MKTAGKILFVLLLGLAVLLPTPSEAQQVSRQNTKAFLKLAQDSSITNSATNASAITAAEAYRRAVLGAVAEAEGALTRLNAALRNLGSAGTLVTEYDAYFAAIDADWRAGRVSLLEREDARRQVQTARITQISQQLALSRQWIALYKAMGGGWQRPSTSSNKG